MKGRQDMSKNFLALLFIPFIFFLYGCNNNTPRLTVEEYSEAMDKAWSQYRDNGYGEFIKVSLETGNDFSEMQEKKAEILAACDKMDADLEEFEKINPPEEYQELHDRLLKSIEDEKRWDEYRRKGFSASTEKEANEYFDKIAEEVTAASRETFPSIYLEIHKKLNNF